MHNLKHRAILGALCGLARERAQCEPRESENKTNDVNGCNYIYGRVLIWPTKSLPFPSHSPAFLLLTHFERQPLDLPLVSFSICHFVPLSLFYHLCLFRQSRREVTSVLLAFLVTLTKIPKCGTAIRRSWWTVIHRHLAHFQIWKDLCGNTWTWLRP